MTTHTTTVTRLLHSPLTRIVLGLIVCIAINVGFQLLITKALDHTAISHPIKSIIKGLMVSFLFIYGYTKFYSFYEKREITEFSSKKIARYIPIGLLLGAVLQGLTIAVIWLNNGFHVVSVNPWTSLWPLVFSGAAIAIIEETLFRGIIFRISEEKLGTYLALALSALIFGALHLLNAHSTIASALAVAIEGGLLLGAAFVYSRNLWFPIAIHFAWNFTQTGIFGAVTSGNALHVSLLTSTISGNPLISGGAFGPEGSVQAMFFCSAAAILLLIICHKQHKIIAPYWSKTKRVSAINPSDTAVSVLISAAKI
jgi:membrane protease YdiL (CAAX protease family)